MKNWVKKYGSYLNIINEKKYHSVYNGKLEINLVNGKRVLDTENTNYSYGNLGKVLHKALKQTKNDFKKEDTELLILGLGGGDAVRQLQKDFKSKAKITAVEIDPVMIEIAINEFNIIPNSKLEILNEDAANFLKYSKIKFNLVIVDLFYDVSIPEFVFQETFINDIFNALTSDGSVIFNTFILENRHEIRNNQFIDRLHTKFDLLSFKNLYCQNNLIF